MLGDPSGDPRGYASQVMLGEHPDSRFVPHHPPGSPQQFPVYAMSPQMGEFEQLNSNCQQYQQPCLSPMHQVPQSPGHPMSMQMPVMMRPGHQMPSQFYHHGNDMPEMPTEISDMPTKGLALSEKSTDESQTHEHQDSLAARSCLSD